METQASKFPPILLWTAGIAVILFCAAGIAAFAGWMPTSMGGTGDGVMPDKHAANTAKPVARTAPAKVRCAECGVIESMREIDVRGEGTGLGAVGGAVVGGVLGHQVGSTMNRVYLIKETSPAEPVRDAATDAAVDRVLAARLVLLHLFRFDGRCFERLEREQEWQQGKHQ